VYEPPTAGPSYSHGPASEALGVLALSGTWPAGPVAVTVASQMGLLVAPLMTVIIGGMSVCELQFALAPPHRTIAGTHNSKSQALIHAG